MAKNTYGTGCFLLMNTGTQPLASKTPAAHHRRLEARSPALCARRQRVRGLAPWCNGCAMDWESSNARRMSKRLPPACRTAAAVYFVPAFTGLGSPHWDPAMRAARSSAFPAAAPKRTSRGRRSRPSHFKAAEASCSDAKRCGSNPSLSYASMAAPRDKQTC